MELNKLGEKSVLLIGMGIEGVSTLQYLIKAFPEKRIAVGDDRALNNHSDVLQRIISDSNGRIQCLLGGEYRSHAAAYDVIVRSPGVAPYLLEELGVSKDKQMVTSQTAIFLDNCHATTIGITGTKGKSTTTSLIHAVLKTHFEKTHLVGNIGIPPLTLLDEQTPDSLYVYEMSSYQLDGIKRSPKVSVLLNLMPEHLNFHRGFKSYVEAKANIFRHQKADDVLVVNADCPTSMEVSENTPSTRILFSRQGSLSKGVWTEKGTIIENISGDGPPVKVIAREDVPLLGDFNINNVLAAVAVGIFFKIPIEKIQQAISQFRPLEHRLEPAGICKGIRFFNDSLSTIPQATIAAIEAFDNNVATLIAGGYDRGVDYQGLVQKIKEINLKNLILFPGTGDRILSIMAEAGLNADNRINCIKVDNMEAAVKSAFQHTKSGEICLMSPASSSFGLFKDYRERGTLFKKYIQQLGEKE